MSQDPFSVLQTMEQSGTRGAPLLLDDSKLAVLWSGVAFRLGDLNLVTPLDHVLEVLPYPDVTPLPGTKSWLKGLANIRGNLLTIVDLPEYFGKSPVTKGVRSRILVMNTGEYSAGLLVNEVLGLRHFDEETERQVLSGLEEPVGEQIIGGFLQEGVLWGVFDMHVLSQNQAFRRVAA
ncbi:MAG: chemotaxis protein CheW [Gammaproteobacteria bacterium]|nr:MAG: chemotaxis protein CheW [Gammaproteobacteria bacterium]